MEFTNRFPEWENKGVEPSAELKQNGWQGGYKPAAPTFNWFWALTMDGMNEVQKNLTDISGNMDLLENKLTNNLERMLVQQDVECFQGYKAVPCADDGNEINGNFYAGIASDNGIDIGYIEGRSIQNGSPTMNNPVAIKSFGDEAVNFYTHGFQLYDASAVNTVTIGGATVTNNGDGSFTVSGSGTLTQEFAYYKTYTHEETVKLLSVGEIKFAAVEEEVYPKALAQFVQNGINKFALRAETVETSAMITQEMLDDPTSRLTIGFYGYNGETEIKRGTVKPMLYQHGEGIWEPFTSLGEEQVPFSAPLRSLPNGVCDTYRNGVVIRRVGCKVLNGSEEWSANGNSYYNAFLDKKNRFDMEKGAISCSHFIEKASTNSAASVTSGEVFEGFYTTGNKNVFFNYDNGSGGVAGFKTWLASNPVTVLYELETPVLETFEIPTLTSYNPNTYAGHDSGIEANLVVWHGLKGGKGGGTSIDLPVPIESGGTGATTIEGARQNLDVASANHTHTEDEIITTNNYVTSSVKMHFSINETGGLRITYDDGN